MAAAGAERSQPGPVSQTVRVMRGRASVGPTSDSWNKCQMLDIKIFKLLDLGFILI